MNVVPTLSFGRMWGLLESSGDFFAVANASGVFEYVTEASARLLGVAVRDLVGTAFLDLLAPADHARAARRWADVLAAPDTVVRDDFRVEAGSGRSACLDVMANNLLGDPCVRGVLLTARDITERRASESANENLSRILATVNAVTETMIGAVNTSTMAASMCRTLVDQGGYRYTVLVTPGETPPRLVPVAAAGEGVDYLSSVDGDASRPLWLAMATGSAQIVNDVAASPPTQWRTECLRRRYHAVIALPIELDGDVWGALGISSDQTGAFDDTEIHVLQRLAADVSFALSMLKTREERDASGRRAERALSAVTETLSKALEWRDPYTAGHERRVAVLSAALGRELGLGDDEIRGIEVAAGIHDIGKIAVPAEILSHPGVLNSAQIELLRAHCQIGYDIVSAADFPWPVAQMVLQHHERLDGSGYPNGLVDRQIGVGARIIAVADVVEAMAAHRPYRPAHPFPEAVGHITQQRGILYDADVADALQLLFEDGRLAAICEQPGTHRD